MRDRLAAAGLVKSSRDQALSRLMDVFPDAGSRTAGRDDGQALIAAKVRIAFRRGASDPPETSRYTVPQLIVASMIAAGVRTG